MIVNTGGLDDTAQRLKGGGHSERRRVYRQLRIDQRSDHRFTEALQRGQVGEYQLQAAIAAVHARAARHGRHRLDRDPVAVRSARSG